MTVRYRFSRDYHHLVSANTIVAYKAGTEDLIPKAHADAADAVGAGERLTRQESRDGARVPQPGAPEGAAGGNT